jgi:hypothetical protein
MGVLNDESLLQTPRSRSDLSGIGPAVSGLSILQSTNQKGFS